MQWLIDTSQKQRKFFFLFYENWFTVPLGADWFCLLRKMVGRFKERMGIPQLLRFHGGYISVLVQSVD
jgi:hypothetical protein